MEERITITMKEYKDLIETKVRTKVLLDYIEYEKHFLDKVRIKGILGISQGKEESRDDV